MQLLVFCLLHPTSLPPPPLAQQQHRRWNKNNAKQRENTSFHLMPLQSNILQEKTFSEPHVLYFSFGRVFSIWYLVF